MKEINQKKLLERFGVIREALNVLTKEVEETMKELSHVSVPRKKKSGLTEDQKIRLLAQVNKKRQFYKHV